MRTYISQEVFRAVPPVLASALTLNNAVMLATVIYIVIQAVYLLRKWWREEQDWEPKDRSHKDESIHG